jgi:hypothetical protein
LARSEIAGSDVKRVGRSLLALWNHPELGLSHKKPGLPVCRAFRPFSPSHAVARLGAVFVRVIHDLQPNKL